MLMYKHQYKLDNDKSGNEIPTMRIFEKSMALLLHFGRGAGINSYDLSDLASHPLAM